MAVGLQLHHSTGPVTSFELFIWILYNMFEPC